MASSTTLLAVVAGSATLLPVVGWLRYLFACCLANAGLWLRYLAGRCGSATLLAVVAGFATLLAVMAIPVSLWYSFMWHPCSTLVVLFPCAVWSPCGLPVTSCGLPVVYQWYFCGLPVVFLFKFCSIPVVFLWSPCCISAVSLWYFCGVPVVF